MKSTALLVAWLSARMLLHAENIDMTRFEKILSEIKKAEKNGGRPSKSALFRRIVLPCACAVMFVSCATLSFEKPAASRSLTGEGVFSAAELASFLRSHKVVPLACTAILVPVALSLCGVLDNKTDDSASVRIRSSFGSIPSTSFVANTRSRSEERRVGKECRSRWSPYH